MDVVQKTTENKNNTKSIIKYSLVLLVFIGALFLSNQNDGPSKLPKVVTDEFTFTAWVNEGEDYLKKNYRWITKILANYIKDLSSETADVETYLFVKENISKYLACKFADFFVSSSRRMSSIATSFFHICRISSRVIIYIYLSILLN